jgi:hypothetical protein
MRAPTVVSVSTSSTFSVASSFEMRAARSFVLQEVAISLRCRREAVRHRDAGLRQVTDHLAERGVFTANGLDVVTAELGEGNGVGAAHAHTHGARILTLDPRGGQVRQSGDGQKNGFFRIRPDRRDRGDDGSQSADAVRRASVQTGDSAIYIYVDKAEEAVRRINATGAAEGVRPVIFSTLVQEDMREIIKRANGLFLDFFDAFLGPLELELKVKSSRAQGRAHGMPDIGAYTLRINATNFALANDDGAITRDYDRADLVLVGVSRSGKTPTCLYMALQYGIFAANFPFAEEEFETGALPASLAKSIASCTD